MKILLPENVKTIIRRLESCGHEAYAVGGCVRDSILGKTPADWDVTTSATPQQIKELFSHTVDTGLAHGTVTVLLGKESYEVTTYRIDGEYLDGRHPARVTFTSLLSEDLKRRDFTINAMAYHPEAGVVDLFGGLEDLQQEMIRCVGNPTARFEEDALRMLRALRFSAQLGFSIEENTYEAIAAMAPAIARVSMERIMGEIVKLLTSEHPETMRLVYESGLSRVFLPEFDAMMETEQNTKHHCYTVGEHTLHALQKVPPEKNLRLAMLLHDVGKPDTRTTDKKGCDHFYGHPEKGAQMTGEILRRLKFDNDTIALVKRLVRYHDERPGGNIRDVRRAMVRMGPACFPGIFTIKRADTLAQSTYHRQEKLEEIEAFETAYQKILAAGDCVQRKDLAINGKDLLALGVPQGAAMGEILQALFTIVVEDPEKNTRSYLLKKAEEYRENGIDAKPFTKS